MALFKLQINGKSYQTEAEADTPLLWVLRDNLGLFGTKYGCGIAQCGACTVHLNGEATRSCVLPVSAVGTSKVTTIEGLSKNGDHPVQKAWDEVDVAQCGYCQAGQIMTAAALLKRKPKPTDEEIEATMSGNICRCGTYHRIREAVKVAATKTK
ncbi:(2Fe-2S)-binding protein [Larkinella insperata]|uniref:Isoquinoline 1-oxidoreductase alpha subunit n=2 Tax=Larkinella TaxID=332157 RepID=A0A327X3L8_LARAB|nr:MULTISPECIES: (2Fe-2S)-binding protein [Larkinella]RAK00185.1 isoquinoline 1-oxidoreductase alpha subunit [Larkinella arboricola]